MRILFVGDLAPTGFGTVTLGLGKELLNLGHDMRFISQNKWDHLPDGWAPRVVGAESFQTMVNILSLDGGAVPDFDVLAGLVRGTSQVALEDGTPWRGWAPETVLLLGDYAATRAFVEMSQAFGEVPTFHYCPIEGVDLPPAWGLMWQTIQPVAMSRFGAEQIAKVVGREVPMVYHGVDTSLYRPVTRADPVEWVTPQGDARLTSREECKRMWVGWFGRGRKEFTVPGLWAGRTDRHMPRKQYNILLRAMFPVLARHPEIGLVIHCRPFDQGGNLADTISKMGAVDLLTSEEELEHLPIGFGILGRPYPQILLPNTGPLVPEALRSLYCAFDLYVSNSSEGFGLTIAEALACGTPALGLDFSSVPEVIGPAGRLAPVAGLIDNEYDHLWAVADRDEFGKMAEYLLTHKTKREDLGRKGPDHIRSTFSWRTAAEQFSALFARPREQVA